MPIVRHFMWQLLQGLKSIHEKDITHRDLKPENILLQYPYEIGKGKNENYLDSTVKICDFGSAKKISKDHMNTPYIVSRYYRAPELILGCSDYTNKIDIWATGCIFAELLCLRPLFPGKSEGSQLIE